MDDRDRRSLLACTSGTTATMGVALNIVGQSVVDNMGKIIHIKASCCNIGSHKELYGVLAELLHGQVALLLTEVSVECLGIISILDEFVGNLLCFYLSATEDDGKDARIEIYHSFQCEIFITCIDQIIDVVHMFSTFVS